jgi:phosphatidylserine/phosphatidylglycerophosphate/cardiolipin synthase-like enzyme
LLFLPSITRMKRAPSSPTKASPWRWFLLAVVLGWGGFTGWHAWLKPLPGGISFTGPDREVAADTVRFLADVTCPGPDGPVIRQEIFDEALHLIAHAEHLIVADLFLFNDYLGQATAAHRHLSREVAAALIARKQARPDLTIVVITDPVNDAYGGGEAAPLRALRDAGIPVVITKLDRLRDSNPLWSGFWRLAVKPLGTSPGGWLPHPFAAAAGKVGLRSWLALLNFKANHRKVIIADTPHRHGEGREPAALVMSANPHDGSSAHGNVAFAVRGAIAEDLLHSESAVLEMSGYPSAPNLADHLRSHLAAPITPTAQMRVLTEGAIRRALLDAFAATGKGDRIDLALFYLSDRKIIAALKSAAARGAHIRLLLDQNRDAFGYAKDGVPNKPVAAELTSAHPNITVRWYDTRGEQFHAKAVLVHRSDRSLLLAGSANLTRRNLANLNLETNLALTAPGDFPALIAAQDWFEGLWHNRTGPCTLPYADGADDSLLRRWKYRVQEATGLGTF